MNEEEIINEIIADLASGLIDAEDDEIAAKLDSYDLDEDTKAEVMEAILDVREAEKVADENIDPINIDSVDKLADSMAKEDNSEVTVTAEDSDNDGDLDNLSVEKEDADDDSVDDDVSSMISLAGNSTEEADEPHDESKLNSNVIDALSAHKW